MPAATIDSLLLEPRYSLIDVARFVRLPVNTLRSWVRGTAYQTAHGARRSEPIVSPPRPNPAYVVSTSPGVSLSFINLVEAHVLSAIRRRHAISLQKARRALRRLRDIMPAEEHPLARVEFKTDGVELFLERYGELVSLTENLQAYMRGILNAFLERVEYNRGFPIRLYPVSRPPLDPQDPRAFDAGPRAIVIDPRVAFGHPVLSGTGIKTSVIHDRWLAGDTLEVLAQDYCREVGEIEEANRWESLCRERSAAA